MNVFKVGEIVLKEKIDGEVWIFTVSDVFDLSDEEYVRNEKYNDTLGDYEPDKELPTNSVATITATSINGESVELKWSPGINGVYPHLSKNGWTKGLFVKLNATLKNWEFPNA